MNEITRNGGKYGHVANNAHKRAGIKRKMQDDKSIHSLKIENIFQGVNGTV